MRKVRETPTCIEMTRTPPLLMNIFILILLAIAILTVGAVPWVLLKKPTSVLIECSRSTGSCVVSERSQRTISLSDIERFEARYEAVKNGSDRRVVVVVKRNHTQEQVCQDLDNAEAKAALHDIAGRLQAFLNTAAQASISAQCETNKSGRGDAVYLGVASMCLFLFFRTFRWLAARSQLVLDKRSGRFRFTQKALLSSAVVVDLPLEDVKAIYASRCGRYANVMASLADGRELEIDVPLRGTWGTMDAAAKAEAEKLAAFAGVANQNAVG